MCQPSQATKAFNKALERFAGQPIDSKTLVKINDHMTYLLKVRAVIVRSIEGAVAI